MSDYRWLTSTDADLYLFKELFDSNNSERTIEHLQWQYVSSYNSSHRFILAGLSNKKGLSGIYAIFQNRFLCNGKQIIGSQSLDTLISPEARGKGLFNKLAEKVFEEATAKGVAFVYGFPNGNSAHGFFNRLKWKNLDPLPFLVLPLSTRYFFNKLPVINRFSKLLPDFSFSKKIKSKDYYSFINNVEIDERYDKLWSTVSKKIKVGVNRDSQYINWRLSRPKENYKNIAVYDAENKMTAICFYTLKSKHGGSIGYIMDLFYLNDEVGTLLLNKVIQNLKDDECDAVLAWNFKHSFNHIAYKKNRFLSLPDKIRPIELHFGVRTFNQNFKNTLANRRNWYLSYFDSDTV